MGTGKLSVWILKKKGGGYPLRELFTTSRSVWGASPIRLVQSLAGGLPVLITLESLIAVALTDFRVLLTEEEMTMFELFERSRLKIGMICSNSSTNNEITRE